MNTAPATMAQPASMTVPQVINIFWQRNVQSFNFGASHRIEVADTLKAVIKDEGVAILAARLQDMISAPVTIVEDVSRRVTQIAPSRFLLGHDAILPGANQPSSKALKEDKVARPPNAFILYRQHHHPLLKAEHPELHNNQISVILGSQWKDEKESTKARYINLAQKLKVKHFIEHPDYQYQPRKPSEKKRRMTRRKAAALAESEQAKSSSSANMTSASSQSPPLAKLNTAMVPDLPTTQGGNVVVELGDETMDDEAFAAMLEKYNQSIPPANTPAAVAARVNGNPPVFYDEPTEATQNDTNFYSSVFDYNPFAGNEELAEEMEGIMSSPEGFQAMRDVLSQRAQEIAFDKQNEPLQNAELERDATLGLGEWSYVFEREPEPKDQTKDQPKGQTEVEPEVEPEAEE